MKESMDNWPTDGPDNPLENPVEMKDLRLNPKKYRRLWQKTEKAWRVQPRADERPIERVYQEHPDGTGEVGLDKTTPRLVG